MGSVMPFLIKPAIFVALVAAVGAPAFMDGNTLLKLCEASDREANGVCMVYIQGVVDEWRFADFLSNAASNTASPVCAPDAIGRQLADAVLNYLKAHPEDRGEPAASLVMEGVMETWHCK